MNSLELKKDSGEPKGEIQNSFGGVRDDVMSRVRTIYIIRRVTNLLGFKVGGLIVLLFTFGWFVSVFNVIRNFWSASNDLTSAYGFVTTAFMNAGLVVQSVSLGIIAVGVFFLIDLYRTFVFLKSGSRLQ